MQKSSKLVLCEKREQQGFGEKLFCFLFKEKQTNKQSFPFKYHKERNVNLFFTFKPFLQTVETQTKPRNSTFATIHFQKSKTTTKK